MLEISDTIKKNSEFVNIDRIMQLLHLILGLNNEGNRVFIYGAGRSGFVGRCFAQRLMHLGINSCFVSDAVTHQYTEKDLVVIISGSGETTSPEAIAQKAKKMSLHSAAGLSAALDKHRRIHKYLRNFNLAAEVYRPQ